MNSEEKRPSPLTISELLEAIHKAVANQADLLDQAETAFSPVLADPSPTPDEGTPTAQPPSALATELANLTNQMSTHNSRLRSLISRSTL